MTSTITNIQARPQYIQEYDEALLARILGIPDEDGVLTGGLVDDPELFQIPEYVQATSGIQDAVAGTFDTAAERQAFMDRYQPYFTDAEGNVRYLPDAASGLQTGQTTIADALTNYFPDAKTYLQEGRGDVGAKGFFDTELTGAKSRADQATDAFQAKQRADALLGEARTTIKGGLGQYTQDPTAYDRARQRIESGQGTFGVNEAAMRRGTGTFGVDQRAFKTGRDMIQGAQGQYDVTGRLGEARDSLRQAAGGTYGIDQAKLEGARQGILGAGEGQFGVDRGAYQGARDALTRAGEGKFGARKAFERGTSRAFELAEQGLGSFDPSSAAQAFMDPYKEQVIDAAMQKIAREGAKARQGEAARAVGAGAFGGSRAGVQIAETQRAQEEARANTIANLMSQGYDKAMANAIATDEASRKRALQASGLTGQLGTSGASLEARAYEDAAKRGLAAATTGAGLTQAEQSQLQSSFNEAKARGLTSAQNAAQFAAEQEKLGMSAFEAGAGRGLKAETSAAGLSQAEEQIRQKAYEDAQARGLQGAQLENAVAESLQKLGLSAFESGAQRTMSAEQQINAAKQKAYESAMARGLTGAQLESAVAQAEEQAKQSAFEAAQKRQMAGGQALGGLGSTQLGTEASAFESAEQRMAKAADMYRSMGLSSAEAQVKAAQDEKKRSLEAGRLMGGLGQTTGALGGAQADIGKAYGALAGTSADIGRVYAGMQPADLGFMYELGGKERQYGQQYEDYLRQNELMKTQQALAPYSFGQTFLTGSPSASMYGQFTSQPSAAPNPFLSGVGAYATLQGMNQQ